VTEKRDTLDDMRSWQGRRIVPGVMVVPYREGDACNLYANLRDLFAAATLKRGSPGLVISLRDNLELHGRGCATIQACVMVQGGRMGWTAAFCLEVVQ
jgi:hypothetical protein